MSRRATPHRAHAKSSDTDPVTRWTSAARSDLRCSRRSPTTRCGGGGRAAPTATGGNWVVDRRRHVNYFGYRRTPVAVAVFTGDPTGGMVGAIAGGSQPVTGELFSAHGAGARGHPLRAPGRCGQRPPSCHGMARVRYAARCDGGRVAARRPAARVRDIRRHGGVRPRPVRVGGRRWTPTTRRRSTRGTARRRARRERGVRSCAGRSTSADPRPRLGAAPGIAASRRTSGDRVSARHVGSDPGGTVSSGGPDGVGTA